MSKKNISTRFKTSVMSLVMAASCVPAAMISVPAGAVTASPSIDITAVKKASSGIGVKETYTGYIADVATSGLKTIYVTFTPDFTGNFVYGFGIGLTVLA